MVFTNAGAQQTIWAIGSNLSNNYMQYYAIGIGSGVEAVTNVALITETGTRVIFTGSPNFTQARIATFIGDYSSVAMSGVLLTEFGLFASGASSVGSTWFRSAFPAITFDGTNELSLSTAIQIIPG